MIAASICVRRVSFSIRLRGRAHGCRCGIAQTADTPLFPEKPIRVLTYLVNQLKAGMNSTPYSNGHGHRFAVAAAGFTRR
jgi:hypothetical protein